MAWVNGISTFSLEASVRAPTVVSTPSATFFMEDRISSSFLPVASCSPRYLFLLRRLEQVATRSPRPARPTKVRGVGPRGYSRRVISTSPRVMKAAFPLSP